MQDTAKTAMALGTGILIGKLGNSFAWWVLGATAAVFVMNSPKTQTTLSAGAKKAASAFRK